MDYYMYLCPDCNKVYKVQGENKRVQCSNCKHPLIDMNKSISEWETLSKEQKEVVKKTIKKTLSTPATHSISTEKSELETGVIGSDTKDNVVDSINDTQTELKHDRTIEQPSFKKCPKCGADVPEKSKFCLECGYNFEEKYVQASAQIQNSFFSNIPEDKQKYATEKETNVVVNHTPPNITPTVDTNKPKNVFLIVLCSVLGTIVIILGVIFFILLKSDNTNRYSGSVDMMPHDTLDKTDSIGEESLEGNKGVEENAENEKKYEEQRKYYEFVQEAVTFTKTQMKHPATFKVSGVIVIIPTSREAGVNAIIEYEADNDLGNSVSDYARYFKDVPKYLDQNVDRAKSTYINDEVIINSNGDSEHTKKEDNSYTYTGSDASYYVFKLNFDDYKASGYAGIE